MIENLFGGGGGGGTVDTITAGTGISVNSTDPANPIITNTSLNTDEVAKVSSNDTTAGYLNGKLVAGSNVTFTENNNGGNETLTIAATVPVTSVNTKTGAVTLTNTDVGAAATSHTHAASDITSGVIATARLASSGTASSSTYLRGDQTWASVGDTLYTVTVADAENTTSQITLAQFTVPANTWNDGDVIHLDCLFTSDNASGSSANVTYTIGGTTITDFSNSNVSYGSGAGVKRNFTKIRFARVGNGVVFEAFTAHNTVDSYVGARPPFFGGGTIPTIDTSATFTSDITLYFKIQFSAANASLYCRLENARAYKVPVGSI